MRARPQRWKRWKRWMAGIVIAAVVLVGGYVGARHYAWPAFKAHRIRVMNRDAQAFLDSGDLSNALLIARKSLQSSTDNPGAWRVAAAAATARGSADALSYQDNLCRVEPTRENYYQLIRLALRFDVPNFALAAIQSVAPLVHHDPAYYRLAVQVYLRIGKLTTARYSLISLTQLDPGDLNARLELAGLDLAADPGHHDPSVRLRVRAMLAEPEYRHRALTMLLRDNIVGKVKDGTAELVQQLGKVDGLTVPDRLLMIEGEQLIGAADAAALLKQLQSDVASHPAQVAQVLDFLVRTGASASAPAWVASLPAETQKDETVQTGIAEILRRERAWPQLEKYLTGQRWVRREYLRQALLASAYRAQGRSAEFTQAWGLALLDAGGNLPKTLELLAKTQAWNWVNERYDVAWKLFLLVPLNDEVRSGLVRWERNQGNTANLNRIFTRVVQAGGADRATQNNLAYTDLLLDSNLLRAAQSAADLVKAEPHNPFFITTRALALYKQGRPVDALALLDTLTLAERSEPVRMLFRAVFLTKLGRVDQAAEVMNDVTLPGMLPEEKRLADGAMLEIARLDRLQGDRSRLRAFSRSGVQGAGRSGWLVLTSTATRTAATPDMQLADSLYETQEWAGLAELLRATQWQGADYLRFALIAYVDRQLGQIGASNDAWTQALAVANRDQAKVQNLRSMVTHWNWPAERLVTTNLVFERNPTDRLMLDELLHDYRAMRRTADLVRVLGLYIANTTDTTNEAVAHAYYSLLLDSNVARAHVVARNAFEAAPADMMRRMVYAFSLWKQGRAAEAVPLLANVPSGTVSGVVPVALLSAAIQAQVGDIAAARASLARFDRANALPEEISLADEITRLLASLTAPAKTPST
ncbi:MAG: hypothetical protein ABI222_08995 [Opitutaceae bacterium]